MPSLLDVCGLSGGASSSRTMTTLSFWTASILSKVLCRVGREALRYSCLGCVAKGRTGVGMRIVEDGVSEMFESMELIINYT